jgi:hypothetical protein
MISVRMRETNFLLFANELHWLRYYTDGREGICGGILGMEAEFGSVPKDG